MTSSTPLPDPPSKFVSDTNIEEKQAPASSQHDHSGTEIPADCSSNQQVNKTESNDAPTLSSDSVPTQSFPATIRQTDVPSSTEIDRKESLNDEPAGERMLVQTHAIVIPSYVSWFNLSHIHELEKRSLPEFFSRRNRSKTSELYMHYRNFMVNTYRLNPADYLTVTACRRNLVGDACAIMRIHSFLDKWGLINYQTKTENRPKEVVPPFTGHWKVLQDTPRGLFPFKFYEGTSDPAAKKLPGGMSQQDLEKAVAVEKEKTKARLKHNAANSSPSASKPNSSSSLAAQPFSNKSALGTSHRIKPGPKWSKKELLALLEGIEKYPKDWEKIASEVGTKTKEEVIFKFLSTSMKTSNSNDSAGLTNDNITAGVGSTSDADQHDQIPGLRKRRRTEQGSIDVDDADSNGDNTQTTESAENNSFHVSRGVIDATSSNPDVLSWANKMGPLKYDLQRVPFAQAENPVLSVVTFLASLVDSNAVAAATSQSIKAVQEKIIEESKQPNNEDKSDENKPGVEVVKDENTTDVKQEDEDKDVDVKMKDSFEATDKHASTNSLPKPDIPVDPSSLPLGSIDSLSSVLQAGAERQLYADLFSHASQQVYKTDAKLSKFLALENLLQTEKREIERERMEVFLDRLVLARKVKKIEEVLSEAVNLVSVDQSHGVFGADGQRGNVGADLKRRLEEKLASAKRIVQEGSKISIESISNVSKAGAANNANDGDDKTSISGVEDDKEKIIPYSVEHPQTFKLWTI